VRSVLSLNPWMGDFDWSSAGFDEARRGVDVVARA
jgi:hypothetical protein